jgi:hypothetical protein
MATEDCYGLPEFYNSWNACFPSASAEAVYESLRAQLASLIDEGLVRVHKGSFCSPDDRADASLELTSDEFRATNVQAWKPEAEPRLNLCATPLTDEAFEREWWNSSRKRFRA